MPRSTDSEGLVRALVRATSRAADADQVLARAAALLAGTLGDWVVADRLLDPDLVVRVAAVGADGPLPLPSGAGGAQSRRSAAGSAGLLPRLAATVGHLLHLRAEDIAGADPADHRLHAQAELVRSLGSAEVVVLGAGARGRLAGVLALGRGPGDPFTPEDLALLADVALQVGLALDAARLLQAQRSVSEALQTSLLPPLPTVPDLELAARYDPAAQGLDVGGDWYDAFALGGSVRSGDLALVIGDATGHDTTAASRMAELRNQLRALAVDRDEPPAATLQRLDRACSRLGATASGTCLYARLSAPDAAGARRLVWSSAGHLPPVVVRAGEAQVLDTEPDLMLGVAPESARSDHETVLAPGDALLLYTDGLVEDRRSSLDERVELLRQVLAARHDLDAEQLSDALIAELASDTEDDVALLLLRVRPPRPLRSTPAAADPGGAG